MVKASTGLLNLIAAATVAGVVAAPWPATAQYYYDPCQPAAPGNIVGAIINQMNAAQRAQACEQARAAAMWRQQETIAAQQARDAEAQRAAVRARAAADAQARAVAAAQEAAENSPDNICHQPEVARRLIDAYNGLDWQTIRPRRVIDIEHLVTIRQDIEKATLICHGIWVHTDGERLEGTMTMRPNVAGDLIVRWEAQHWQPQVAVASIPQEPQQSPPSPVNLPAAQSLRHGPPPDEQSASFQQGRADRLEWERWFASLDGDTRVGALFWSAERRKSQPGICSGSPEFRAGCIEARSRLTGPDAKRTSDPQYWWGWNSL